MKTSAVVAILISPLCVAFSPIQTECELAFQKYRDTEYRAEKLEGKIEENKDFLSGMEEDFSPSPSRRPYNPSFRGRNPSFRRRYRGFRVHGQRSLQGSPNPEEFLKHKVASDRKELEGLVEKMHSILKEAENLNLCTEDWEQDTLEYYQGKLEELTEKLTEKLEETEGSEDSKQYGKSIYDPNANGPQVNPQILPEIQIHPDSLIFPVFGQPPNPNDEELAEFEEFLNFRRHLN